MKISPASSVDLSDDLTRELGLIGQTAGSIFDVDALLGNSYDDIVYDASYVSAPAINTIFANTGNLPEGKYEIFWGAGGNSAANIMYVQYRDNGDSVVDEFNAFVPGFGFNSGKFIAEITANEDFIITNKTASANEYSAYIAARRLVTA